MNQAARVFRGSRKHILDWVESPAFLGELGALLRPLPVVIPAPTTHVPNGYASPQELELDRPDSPFAVLDDIREELSRWWLVHRRGAKTPNWDLVVACEIEGRTGLILVEAKANCAELKVEGKTVLGEVESPSGRNHARIREAIAEARAGLKAAGYATRIDIDCYYQLANRVAFTWKLASLGIPTILVYLGFTGDAGIRDVGEPFADDTHWQRIFLEHARDLVPATMFERRLDLPNAPAWLIVRSRGVREPSVGDVL